MTRRLEFQMDTQCHKAEEKTNFPSNDSALTPKASRRHSRIGVAVLVLFLWLFLVVLVFLAKGSLASAYFWASFLAFAVSFSAGALSGDPNPPPDERSVYPLQLSRRQHLVIGVGIILLMFFFAIVLNSSLEKNLKWDVLYGATTGGWTAMALSGTYLEFIRGRGRPS